VTPGKASGGGAYPNGGEAEEQLGTAAFAGREGVPVGGDGECGVMQHRCERGKLGLAPNWEWCSSEGAHRRGGRRRQRLAKSGVKERPTVARGRGPGMGAVGREVALEGAGGESVTREWMRGVTFERPRSTARLRGEKEGRRGGEVRPRGCHDARGRSWGLTPTGGRRPAAARDWRACTTCAARSLPAEQRRGGGGLTGGPAQEEKKSGPTLDEQ
jgi:hypothetical protein